MKWGHVEVWRAEEGDGEMAKVLETDDDNNPCTVLETDSIGFWSIGTSWVEIDDVRVVSDDLSTTTIFEYNDANEQTKMRMYETTTAYTDTDFTYDDWGRMVTRTMGAHTAVYTWGHGGKLRGVQSDFPDEFPLIWANYDGEGRWRNLQRWYSNDPNDNDLLWWRYDSGSRIVGAYAGTPGSWDVGEPTSRLSHDPASADGAPLAVSANFPGSGELLLNVERDSLGSLRDIRYEGDNSAVTHDEYGPYGEPYTESGGDFLIGYTGHLRMTPNAGYPLYSAPNRIYGPASARWLSSDPIGWVSGPNSYIYASNNPISTIESSSTGPSTGAYTETYRIRCGLRDTVEAGAASGCARAQHDVGGRLVWFTGLGAKCSPNARTPIVGSYTALFQQLEGFLKGKLTGAYAFGQAYHQAVASTPGISALESSLVLQIALRVIFGDVWPTISQFDRQKRNATVVVFPWAIGATRGGHSIEHWGNVLLHEYGHFGGCNDGIQDAAGIRLGCETLPFYPYEWVQR